MSEPSHRELVWIDKPARELCRQSWPIAVSMLSYSAMTLVDTMFVGQLGPAALAGVGLAGVVSFALLVFCMGLQRGVKVLVAQSIGAGKPERAREYLASGVVLAVALGLLVAAIGQLLAAAVVPLAASPAAGAHAATYLSIRILGAPMLLAYVAMRETEYGRGSTRPAMVASIAANLSNIALAYWFVFHLDMGVSGVAWSTVISHAVEAGTLLGLRRSELVPRWSAALSRVPAVLRMGLPTAVQFTIEVGAFTMLTVLISAMSEADMAGHQIALHAIHFAFLPGLAVSEAGSVMAGQAVGAGRDELVLAVARLAMMVTGAYAIVCTLVLGVFAPSIARLFTSDATVLATAVPLLYVASVFQIADAANVVARGVLRGTGDVRYPAVIAVTAAWTITPPLCWLLGHQLGLGALGGWIGLSLEIFGVALLFWRRLARRDWLPAAERARAELEQSAELEPRLAVSAA